MTEKQFSIKQFPNSRLFTVFQEISGGPFLKVFHVELIESFNTKN